MSEWIDQVIEQSDQAPIEICVVRGQDGWRIRASGMTSAPHGSYNEAIQEAMAGARQLATSGVSSRVVMRLLTCPFHPHGIGRAYPTAGRATPYGELGLLTTR